MLNIKRHIVRKDWMLAPETTKLFQLLQTGAPEDTPQALFVGGAVRNALLDRAVDDVDIATCLTPDKVIKTLENAAVRVIPTGIDHGTVTAIMGDYVYEITTLRRDMQTDGRRAVVAYTDCWVEDAKRRDFTMNTLLMDVKGNIYDPLDCGLADLEARHVRFVGAPAQRIEEDALRILRFFRFSALYGEAGMFDAEGLSACKNAAQEINTLSRERITQEFFKIIASKTPYNVLKTMFSYGILKDYDFSDDHLKLFAHVCTFQDRYALFSLSARLFVCAALTFENIKIMGRHILFPKVFIKDMKAINGALHLPDLSIDHAVREAIYRFGRTATAQALMIELAQDRVMNASAPQVLHLIQNWEIPTFPITGQDLITRGIPPSPALGQELTRLENAWIAGGFKPTSPQGAWT